MTAPLVEVSALDHVHIYVADPKTAVEWYGKILGLQPFETQRGGEFAAAGSVYMATPRGQYCATIFRGKPPSDGDHTSAFRVPGHMFIQFGQALASAKVSARNGVRLAKGDAVDHELAFSYYFSDPDGNHLELTSYDHDKVRAWIDETGQEKP